MQKPPEPIGSGGTLPGRHPSRPCDVAESCTGVGASCPADGVEPPTMECRVPAHVCDAAESCTGSSVDCPADDVLDGVPCLDGDLCNGAEQCVTGVCIPGVLLDCDDADACTADSCDAVQGCVNTPIEACSAAIPATSEWGVILMALLITAAGGLMLEQKRRWQA